MIAGTLQIEMSANVARLSKDMADAKRKVSDTMDSINTAIARTTGILATLGVGVSFAAIIGQFRSVVDAAAKLDDMAEKTGASVESLSKLSQVARIGGHSLETVETAAIKLAKALHSQGDEAKGSGKALAALGLSQDALRNKDTADALRTVAVELAKYEDGAAKTALAIDLLGKSGAQALPFLKDLATEQGISARVTAEQAAQAEELQKSLKRLGNSLSLAKEQFALGLVPAALRVVTVLTETYKATGSLAQSINAMASLRWFGGDTAEQIKNIGAELEKVNKQQLIFNGILAKPLLGIRESNLLALRSAALAQQRAEALALPGGDTPGEMQRFGLAGRKLALDYKAVGDAAKDTTADLRRLTAEIDKLAATMDLPLPKMPILMAGETVDVAKKRLEDTKKLLEEGRKGWIAYAESVFAAADAENNAAASGESFTQWAEKTRDKVLDLIDPLRKLKKEHEDLDLLVSTGWMTEMDARLAKLPQSVRDLLQPLKNIHDEIQKAWEAGLLSNEQMQEALSRANDKLEKTTDSAKDFGHAISTAFEDAVIEGRKFGDVVKALGVTIAKIFFRKSVTGPLENAIGGLDILGVLKGLMNIGGTPINTDGFGGGQSFASPSETMAFWGEAHRGGIVGSLAGRHAVNADHFYNAPRFHRGGIAGGEVPIVAKVGEGIFTPEQMRALQPAGGSGVTYAPTFNVDSRTDRAEIISLMRREDAKTVERIADLTRRGGAYSKAVRGR